MSTQAPKQGAGMQLDSSGRPAPADESASAAVRAQRRGDERAASAGSFDLTDAPIDVAALAHAMSDERAGAFVTFEGRVRNHNEGRPVVDLEYEAYPRMAAGEGERVLAEARERFDVIDARCIHRLGRLAIGEVAVWVGVLASHRDEGFAACRYIIDEVKSRVPIWKKEHYREGDSSWVGAEPR